MKTKPWMMLVAMMAGWINRQQQDALAYLMEENKILRAELYNATGKKLFLIWNKVKCTNDPLFPSGYFPNHKFNYMLH